MRVGVILCFFSLLAIFFYLRSPKEGASPAIRIAWSSFPRSYDPRYATDADSQYLEDLLHCSLISFDPTGEVVHSVAQHLGWKDSTTVEITIHPDFKFSDGQPVTIEDVKATYEFFIKGPQDKEQTPSPRALAFRNIKSLEVDGEVLRISLKEPDAPFESNLVVGILPKSYAEGALIDEKNIPPSCGSFAFKKATLNSITLEKNIYHPEYHRNSLERVEIHVVKDESTRFSKLQKGEVDIVQNSINFQKIGSLDNYPELKLLKKDALKTSYLGFNFKHPILKQEKVREALASGVHKKNLIDYVLKGLGSEASSLLPPDNFFASGDKSLVVSYDLEKARKLLDEAGYSLREGEKFRFSLNLTLTNNPTRYAIARALVTDFAKMGIDLKVKVLEWGSFQQNVEKGRVDMWLLTWIGFKDPDIYRYAFASESFPPNGANRGWFENHKLDALLKKGVTTYGSSERKKIYLEVEEIIAKTKPYIFLYHDQNFAFIRKNVQNFTLYADGRYSSLREVQKTK